MKRTWKKLVAFVAAGCILLTNVSSAVCAKEDHNYLMAEDKQFEFPQTVIPK